MNQRDNGFYEGKAVAMYFVAGRDLRMLYLKKCEWCERRILIILIYENENLND